MHYGIEWGNWTSTDTSLTIVNIPLAINSLSQLFICSQGSLTSVRIADNSKTSIRIQTAVSGNMTRWGLLAN